MHDRRFVTSLGALVALALAAASPAWAERRTGAADAARPELPTIKSEAAVVLDLRTGAELFGKNPDEVRAIASTTKIFVALAVRRKGMDLDGWTAIDSGDARWARGGSRTRLDVGQSFRNIDLLRAMLMASDNRAPTALGRAAGMSRDQLIAEMNDVARDLGLKKTRFTDASGLRGNVSTAREMALGLRAALADPVLADIMSTRWYEVKSRSGFNKVPYSSTNQPLIVGKYKVLGGKTGFTRAAKYCYITGAEIDDHRYVMAFLGAGEKATRFADFSRVAAWIDDGAPGARVKPRAEAKSPPPAVRRRAVGHAKRR
jgi:D-alanyl-D-alanine endopeptidase (penicillin-binding protein 7)